VRADLEHAVRCSLVRLAAERGGELVFPGGAVPIGQLRADLEPPRTTIGGEQREFAGNPEGARGG